MHFNRYVFDCYLSTEEGQQAVIFFEQLPQQIRQRKSDLLFSFLSGHQLDLGEPDELQEQVDFSLHYNKLSLRDPVMQNIINVIHEAF